MVDIVIAALIDVIKTQKDVTTGNAELQDVKDSSSRFIKALNELIDSRINKIIDERRNIKNQEKANIKTIAALNSAPVPLEECDLDDHEYVLEWFREYSHWYTKRLL
jgi:septal ring factor EnvC (AmiA/AmiB activator)